MARDRKRSKQRGPRTDRAARKPQHPTEPDQASSREEDSPIDEALPQFEHASADIDIANAQLAVGRPELTDDGDPDLSTEDEGGRAPDELQEGIAVAGTGREARRQRRLAQMRAREEEQEQTAAAAAEQEEATTTAPPPDRRGKGGVNADELRPTEGPRVIAFLQASWRELQRVQWPDRQQVAQATGVVLVFVVIAGLYLGLTGEIASRIVKAIL